MKRTGALHDKRHRQTSAPIKATYVFMKTASTPGWLHSEAFMNGLTIRWTALDSSDDFRDQVVESFLCVLCAREISPSNFCRICTVTSLRFIKKHKTS